MVPTTGPRKGAFLFVAFVAVCLQFVHVETNNHGEKNDAVSPSVNQPTVLSASHRTSLFVAGILNGALETGLNPEWFQLKHRRSHDGFLDAAFAEGGLATPSGKPSREDWTLTVRMNADGDDDSADSPYKRITASSAITSWKRYAYGKRELTAHARARFVKLMCVVELHVRGLHKEADDVLSTFDFDGVDYDCFLQVATCGDVIYG